MTNERLRSAMAAARIDLDAVADAASVDPKTVQRWLNGRVPHARHRWKLVELLGEEETYLWPEAANGSRGHDASKAELVTLYPQRVDVPSSCGQRCFDAPIARSTSRSTPPSFCTSSSPTSTTYSLRKPTPAVASGSRSATPTASGSTPAATKNASATASPAAASSRSCTTGHCSGSPR